MRLVSVFTAINVPIHLKRICCNGLHYCRHIHTLRIIAGTLCMYMLHSSCRIVFRKDHFHPLIDVKSPILIYSRQNDGYQLLILSYACMHAYIQYSIFSASSDGLFSELIVQNIKCGILIIANNTLVLK